MAFAIGLDYGTNSVRCLVVDVNNGSELGTAVYELSRPRKQSLHLMLIWLLELA